MWAEVDPWRMIKESGLNLEWSFIEELVNTVHYLLKINCIVVGQLRFLHEQVLNMLKRFRAESSADTLPSHSGAIKLL
jgi:hypothetical protein